MIMENFNENVCFICEKTLCSGEVVAVKEKGISTLIASSEKRQDGKAVQLVGSNTVTIHQKCRKLYTNEKSIRAYRKKPGEPSAIPRNEPKLLNEQFDYKNKCLFCAKVITKEFLEAEQKKPAGKRIEIFRIRASNAKEGIIKAANQHDDDWSQQVLSRIESVDLFSVGAQYHRPCYSKFCHPVRSSGFKAGRPPVEDVSIAMMRIFEYIEENSDQCQFTLRELSCAVANPPSETTIKTKLEERYGADIIITNRVGRTPIICFRSHLTLRESWYSDKKIDEKEERSRIVHTAASIIAEDIKSKIYDTDYYPSPENFLNSAEEDVPETLRILLKEIILRGKRKSRDKYSTQCTAIAHSIIAATRPRSFLSSLLIGLAAFLHSKQGSKHLINVLSALGFCASYSEAEAFQLSAVMHPETVDQTGFIQFVADNADVNLDTLDGLGTFHAMGMIGCTTPKPRPASISRGIFRITNLPSSVLLGNFGQITVKTFEKHSNLSSDSLETLKVLQVDNNERILPRVSDILWMYGKYKDFPRICGWNGFMEQMTSSRNFSISDIIPMPFVNAPPSQYNTIYTTLLSAAERSQQMRQQTCIVTFDQPLYQKARDIVSSNSNPLLKNVIVRLGGFHMLMSYLGCIGYIMSGSGLKEILSLIYAPTSMEKMMTGHAYARAIRGYLLTNLALGRIIINMVDFTEDEILEMEDILVNFDDGNCERQLHQQVFQTITDKVEAQLNRLEQNGPTAKLWIQYFRMVCLVKQFIEAERTGNWELHLTTIEKMLPFFHAAGHFNYALSAHLYWQDMRQLQSKLTISEYRNFVSNGFFTIRRSNKFWSGLWSDMTIEQTLMRMMKTNGGVTRGRGMTDSVLTKWILGMPVMHRVSEAIEQFTCILSSSTEQHIDLRPSRVFRDNTDTEKLFNWFSQHPPFLVLNKLVSLGTGTVGGNNINCHDAQKIGIDGMKEMVGKTFAKISFSRKKRVLPLSAVSSSIKIADTVVPVDPGLLFQRITFVKETQEDLKKYFEYELAPYPLSLFDDFGMRKSAKAAIYSLFSPIDTITGGDVCYVIDGGHLLHKVVWKKGQTFSFIADQYVRYVHSNYNRNSVIVFDGYSEDVTKRSTKSAERLRRYTKSISADTIFEESMQATVSQEKFLSNESNKSRLITMLMKKFKNEGFLVKQHEEDADTLIINTAFQMAADYESVIVVGEDIDLLVILTGTVSETLKNVYFLKPGRGKSAKYLYSCRSLKDPSLTNHILFYHAFTGCDTTSALFNQGKIKVTTLLTKNAELRPSLDLFKDPNANQDDIDDAGEKVFVALYGGQHGDSLDETRYAAFVRCITKSKFNLASLPPTKAAARQHSLRTYHQVQQWLGHKAEPERWGWKQETNGLIPILTLKEPAPSELLKFVTCRCEKGCEKRCGCRKAGLKCSEICFFCHGQACTNSQSIDHDQTDCEEDDYDLQRDQWLTQTDKYGQPLDTYLHEFRQLSEAEESENEETGDTENPGPSYYNYPKRLKPSK